MAIIFSASHQLWGIVPDAQPQSRHDTRGREGHAGALSSACPSIIFWRRLLPRRKFPTAFLVAEPLEDRVLELEGHKLIAVNAGRTDTAHSTCLHVPSIGLIAAGDAV